MALGLRALAAGNTQGSHTQTRLPSCGGGREPVLGHVCLRQADALCSGKDQGTGKAGLGGQGRYLGLLQQACIPASGVLNWMAA